ncbi:tannase/feruloyl esterase family alpha/beta hydrolase [Novosphingobium sp.]|uniref:tannase/feruloyl esterase family alpha/beta hydrolase n=1 Tax=Novosphingobium sp. TaxID=1874826 RepID=UPI00262DAC63|nr:tannase/feruloyl esterase family alpha/beta hydrolase [Novosphingobium sp.]
MSKLSLPIAKTLLGRSALLAGLAVSQMTFSSSASGKTADPSVSLPACDRTIADAFQPDANTRVVQVAHFSKGAPLTFEPEHPTNTPIATNDVCMVKLMVGPGNPGPAGAASTSEGIGIEIWLPDRANWNGRLHALGGGGWQGGPAGVAGALASPQAAMVAAAEGAVSSITDTGHTVMSGGFAVLPNGAINSRLWTDFASRAIHEQAVKSKALAAYYYGRPPRHSYWEGGSTGGRQGLNLAQNHPDDFDGIIAMFPALNWTRFITSELYPHIVIQRDLGGRALTKGQLDLVSNAAIAACDSVGGEHLGYIIDAASCRYDPVRDKAVLCIADGGSNAADTCVSSAEARALNKVWFGMTSDGSAPDPVTDNGWAKGWDNAGRTLAAKDNLRHWFGLTRGTTLYLDYPGFEGLMNPDHPFSIATHVVALEMQDPAIAEPLFRSAAGSGQSGWKHLTYAKLADAYARGLALQPQFGHINTSNPDLGAFRKRGGKLLTWHGMADEVIPVQGTIHYYSSVASRMGGVDRVRDFYRLYLVPGLGHGTPNGTSNHAAVIPNFEPGQMYAALTAWVERKTTPPRKMILSAGQGPASRSMPICPFPEKITYVAGDPKQAQSYSCSRPKR